MTANRTVGYTFLAKDQFTAQARNIASAMDKVGAATNRTETATRRVTVAQKKHVEFMGKAAREVAAFAAGFVTINAARAAISEIATLDDAVLKVMSQIRDPAEKKLHRERVEAMIRDNARLGKSYDDLAEAMSAHLSDVGFNERGFESFGLRMKLAVGANTPTTTAVMAMNKIVENFPKLAKDEELIAATLYEVQRVGKATMAELATYAPNVAAMAAGQRVGFVESMALFGTLTKSLGSTGESATATEAIILALTQPSKLQRAALKKFAGITATPQEMERVGLTAQLEKLATALARNPQLARALLTEKAAITAAGKLGQPGTGEALLRQIEQITADAKDDVATGRGLDSAFADKADSISASMSSTGQSVANLNYTIGEELAPFVRRIAEFLSRNEGAINSGASGLLGPSTNRNKSGQETSFVGDLLFGSIIDAAISAARARGGKKPLDTGVQGE